MFRDRDLVSLLEAGALNTPDKKIYSFLDKDLICTDTMTYAGLFDEALRMACILQRRGLNRTPVLLVQQRNIDFVRSFWACILAGAWPMPCARPRGYKWAQLADIAVQSKASAIITSSVIARFIPRHEISEIPVMTLDESMVELENPWFSWIRPSVRADDIAFIQYTSGSTSNPKGVVITHGNLLANLNRISQDFHCSDQDTGLSWLPLHHDMGLIGHVLQPVYAGIHNYFLSPTDFIANPLRWLEAISRYGVTISGGPGFAYGLCLREGSLQPGLDLSQWRIAYCGSDRITASTLNQFADQFRGSGFSEDAWFPCYGMAESTLYVCGRQGLTLSGNADKPHVCVGSVANSDAASGTDIKIVDPVSGDICPDRVAGEIWISSDSISPGYYRQSVLSRHSFNQRLHGSGEYFRTGDLGFIEEGGVYFSGRLKNLIKIRGRSLHAEDIEVLLQHETADLGVQRCVVLGISTDEGDSFVILIELQRRKRSGSGADEKSLERKLRNLVCDTFGVIPHAVMILPAASLPLTSSGKLVRTMCYEVYARSSRINTEPVRAEELVNA